MQLCNFFPKKLQQSGSEVFSLFSQWSFGVKLKNDDNRRFEMSWWETDFHQFKSEQKSLIFFFFFVARNVKDAISPYSDKMHCIIVICLIYFDAQLVHRYGAGKLATFKYKYLNLRIISITALLVSYVVPFFRTITQT